MSTHYNRLAVSSAYSAANYLPAMLKTNKSGWLIEYYVENPQTQELSRKRIKLQRLLSRYPTKTEAKKHINNIIIALNMKLSTGWNPYFQGEDSRLYTPLLEVLEKMLKIKSFIKIVVLCVPFKLKTSLRTLSTAKTRNSIAETVIVFLLSLPHLKQHFYLLHNKKNNSMKRIIILLFTLLGLVTACNQQDFDNINVTGFSAKISDTDVVILDVRTAEEFCEGHIQHALNIDIKQDGFVEKVKSALPYGKTIAVYCKGGKRSANAAALLAKEGYKVVNLEGGIMAWKDAEMPLEMADAYEVDSFTTQNGKMANIKDIDIAFLPCNQPYTMTVDQLVNAARMVNPKVLFPYHYGQTDVSGIPSQLEADGTDVRIRHYE